jgi:hypothetical protein
MGGAVYQAVDSCLPSSHAHFRQRVPSAAHPPSPPMKLHTLHTPASWLRSRRRRKGVADAKPSDMATAHAEEKHQADLSDDASKTESNLGLILDTTPAYTPMAAAESLKVKPSTPICPYSRPVEEIREEEYPHMSNGRTSQHHYPGSSRVIHHILTNKRSLPRSLRHNHLRTLTHHTGRPPADDKPLRQSPLGQRARPPLGCHGR